MTPDTIWKLEPKSLCHVSLKPNQLHIDFEIGLRKIALRLRTNQDVGVDFLLQGIVSRQKCYTSTFFRIDLYFSNQNSSKGSNFEYVVILELDLCFANRLLAINSKTHFVTIMVSWMNDLFTCGSPGLSYLDWAQNSPPVCNNTLLLQDDSYRAGLSGKVFYEHCDLAIKIPTCLPNEKITNQVWVDKLPRQKLS